MDNPCSFCGGASHPATGCVYGPRTIACWRCTLQAWEWVRAHTNSKGRKPRNGGARPALSFYEAAGRKP
jgi:hypothetical protein